MSSARAVHTATLLPDGRLLVAGGYTTSSATSSTSEVYDPTTGVFSTLRTFSPERAGATASLTSLGVVMVGGINPTGTLKGVTRFDLATTSWTAASPLPTHDRANHCAAVIGSGAGERLLVFGGVMLVTTSGIALNDGYSFSTATGAWTTIAGMTDARSAHACGMVGYLSDKRDYYLAAGGSGLSTTEIYDPKSNSWKALGSLSEGRHSAGFGVLSDGRFLVAGGLTGAAGPSRAVDVYAPLTATWAARASMIEARVEACATALPNGDFVVASGRGAAGVLHSSVEVYDPRTNIWTALPPMSTGRQNGTMTVVSLGGGHWGVLAVGGLGASGNVSSTELLTLDVNGTACSVGATCESGFCADGVCCDAACDGSCEACAESSKVGSCVAVTAPRTGHAACPATGTGLCASRCDGVERKTCVLPDASTICWSDCAGDDAFASKCDGAGTCSTPTNVSCGTFKCVDKACATSCTVETEAQRCKSTAYCDGGACVAKKADGVTCGEARACTSTACCTSNHLCGACPPSEPGREVAEPWCSCQAPGAAGHGLGLLGVLAALGVARARRR